MRDIPEFQRKLGEHFPLPMEWIIGAPVTAQELEADAQSFVAFAKAMGVTPRVGSSEEDPAVVPSTPAS